MSEVGENTVFAKIVAKSNEPMKIKLKIYHFISSIFLKSEIIRLMNSKKSKPPPKIMIIKNKNVLLN